ncbi:MAG: aminotransferase class I/II-fold pyridoxal phosphate-dependent enzyme [Planctomycetes bacterium]|nr:aminotransferase class I/II-fold pyridoxal phosphate-dependent enzyme [Planctomycetota bacterium]
MEIQTSRRLGSLTAYAFAAVDEEVAKLKARNITPIDFGVGDPTDPTPDFIRKACQEAIDTRSTSGYPPYNGAGYYREAVAAWTKRRYGVDLDPNTEVCSTVGSKEAIFNFAEGFIDPGDAVLLPVPGYPPYSRGTLFSEGVSQYYPLRERDEFLFDFSTIPDRVLKRTKLIWLNYPNSPTGRVAPKEYIEEVYKLCQRHEIILCSDEAYSEIYFTKEPPVSALNVGRDGVVVFQSLSKRSAMTGYRIGWVSGDARIVSAFKKVKTNIDSGTPWFIQDAGVAALSDEKHVEAFRESYRKKRDIIVGAFEAIGLPKSVPESTIYIWQRVPDGMTSVDFAKALLVPEVAIVTTPGEWLSTKIENEPDHGANFVRLALVPSIDECLAAAKRIRELKL